MKFFIRLDAGSEAVRWQPREGLWKWRCRGKRGKAQAAFPLFPPPLGNLAKSARFPHSHSLASPRMEKWKTKVRFPTFPRGARNDSYGLSGSRTKNQEWRSAAARPPPHFPGSPCIGNGNRSPDHPNRRTEESRLRHEEGASLIHSFTPNATHAEQRGRRFKASAHSRSSASREVTMKSGGSGSCEICSNISIHEPKETSQS